MTEARSGSLRTGLQVLDVLCAHPAGLGVTELAARIGKDKGNLHRLLRILEEEGHVQQDLPTKRYRPTVKIVNLASSLLRNLDLLEIARPVMRALKQSTKETVHLAHRTAQGGVYIAQERATGRLTVETDIKSMKNVSAVFNEMVAAPISGLSARANDSYLTTRIKGAFVATGGVPSNSMKVVTEASKVYLMGIVTDAEANRAVEIARSVPGVKQVTKVFDLISEADKNRLDGAK